MSAITTEAPAKPLKVQALTLVTIILGLWGLGLSIWSLINANQPIVHIPGEVTFGPPLEQVAQSVTIASIIGILLSLIAIFLAAPRIWSLQPGAQFLPFLFVPIFSFLTVTYDSASNLSFAPYWLQDLLDILGIIVAIYAISAYFLLRKDISKAEVQYDSSEMDKRLLRALEALGDGWFSDEDIADSLKQPSLKSWDIQTLDKLIAQGYVERDTDEDQPDRWLYHLVKGANELLIAWFKNPRIRIFFARRRREFYGCYVGTG